MLFVRERCVMDIQIREFVCAIHEIFQTVSYWITSREILDYAARVVLYDHLTRIVCL